MDKQERIDRAVIELDGEPEKAKYCVDLHVRVLACRDGEYLWAESKSPAGLGALGYSAICTYPEFMEARKRLENKPSWDSAPNWVKALGQDSDGTWVFLPHYDLKDHDHEEWLVNNTNSGDYDARPKGHVFGDWRQSLEPRPQFRNSEHHDHKDGESVKWEPGVDLPPAGVDCLHARGGDKWEWCHIVAHTEHPGSSDGVTVAVYRTGDKIDWAANPRVFKPIQSHRDKVIEVAMDVGKPRGCDGYKEAYGCLYDAGMLKLPGDEQ